MNAETSANCALPGEPVASADCQTAGSEPVRPEAPVATCSATITTASSTCRPGSAETSEIKQVAAAALILGQNVTKTAEALGVDRRTVQRWGKFDPEFQEAMKETKLEVVITSRQSLLALAESAAEKVETKLSAEQSPRVALALLRGMGILGAHALVPPSFTAERKNEKCAQSATLKKNVSRKSATNKTDDLAGSERDAAEPETEQIYQWSDLQPEQILVMQHLFEGKPLAEVAALASITEETVRHWLCRDNCFFTLLSGLQFERILRLKHRLLKLTTDAMNIVRQAIQGGDARVAMALLRGLGLMG